MKNSTQIVLIGGGYVSVWAYRSLVKRLRFQLADGRVDITVICPNTHHAFHGWTAETLTSILQEKNQVSPLADIMPNARLVRGQATAIDTVTNTVHVRLPGGSQQIKITYDHLLLGTGAFDSEAVEGIQQYGYQIKAHDAFQQTKQTIQSLVKRAANEHPAMARNLLTFTVAGAGFTGVELATNLVEYVGILKKQYPSLATINPQVRLVHTGDRVLPTLQPTYGRLVKHAEKIIAQYGIELLNNRRLTQITPEGAFLSDGSFLPSSMVLSTVGQTRIQLPGTEGMVRDNLHRLYTNNYQQISGYTTIWGGGDACHIKHYQTGEACPANALWAIKHGDYVGRNIARAIKGQPLKPFTYRGLGQSASFGVGKGIAELHGIQFTGALAWLMRWFFFNYFMPSRMVMLRGLSDWLFLALRGQRKGLWLEQQAAATESSLVLQAQIVNSNNL